jgi:hypothetical protein
MNDNGMKGLRHDVAFVPWPECGVCVFEVDGGVVRVDA